MQRYAHFVSITTKAIVAAYERNFSICPENECNCLLCRILEDPRLRRALDKNKSRGSPIWKTQLSGPGGRGSQWQPRGERREERQKKETSEKKKHFAPAHLLEQTTSCSDHLHQVLAPWLVSLIKQFPFCLLLQREWQLRIK